MARKLLIGSRRILLPPSSSVVDEDSFEGTTSSDWDLEMWSAGGSAGSFESGLETVGEVTPPTGGGTRTARQWWHNSLEASVPRELQYNFPAGTTTDEGDIFEIEYWLKYDPDFLYTDPPTIKSIIIKNTSGGSPMYINSHAGSSGSGALSIIMPETSDTHWLPANIGGHFYFPTDGTWTHVLWKIKVANEDQGDPKTGYIHGWINDTQRWNYNNINTNAVGTISYFVLNSTYNVGIYGANQKRYWDKFAITTTAS